MMTKKLLFETIWFYNEGQCFYKFKKSLERASCHDDRSVRIYQSQKVPPLGLSRKRWGKDTWFSSHDK